jgi:hypothetical protein
VGSFFYTLFRYDTANDVADVYAFFFSELLGAAELALLADPFTFGYVEHLPFEGEGSARARVDLRREEVEAAELSMPPETLRELELHRLTHFAILDVFFLRGAQHLYSVALRSPRPPRFYASPTTRHVVGIVELDEPLLDTYLRRAALETGDRVTRPLAKAGLLSLLCPAPLRIYRRDGEHLMLPAPSVEVRIDCLLGSSAVERWRAVTSLQVEGKLGRAWLEGDGLHLVPADGLTPDRVLAMSEELERLEEELQSQRFARGARASLVGGAAELREAFRASDVWVSGGALYIRPHYAEVAEKLKGLTGAEVEVRVIPREQAVFSDEVIAVWRFLRRVEELLS